MKKSRACVILLVLAASGNQFSMGQAPSAKKAAKKERARESAEQRASREIYGKIQTINGALVTVRMRTGSVAQVDAKPAMEAQRSVPLVVGRAIAVKGTMDKAGVIHAETLQRAKDSPGLWPADR